MRSPLVPRSVARRLLRAAASSARRDRRRRTKTDTICGCATASSSNAARLAEYRAAIHEDRRRRRLADASTPRATSSPPALSGLLGDEHARRRDAVRATARSSSEHPRARRSRVAAGCRASCDASGDEGSSCARRRSTGTARIVIAANTDVGVLYGAFALAARRCRRTRSLATSRSPTRREIQLRMLDHWDNLDRSVERGYAGQSLWDWAASARFAAAALSRLRARQRVARHQRRGAHERERERAACSRRRISPRSRRWPACFVRTASGCFSPRDSARRSRSAG